MSLIEKAIDLFNKGFNTKSAQKECIELVSRTYSEARKKITHGLLKLRDDEVMENDEKFNDLYWALPFDLHNYRPKHSEMFSSLFPEEVKEIEYLFELRKQIKETPIVKVERNTTDEKVERIEKSLKEIFEYQKESYERGLEISKLFKYLPVTVTPHWVYRDGTQFIRYFYYLAGKLTALNTIIAVLQTIEEDKINE